MTVGQYYKMLGWIVKAICVCNIGLQSNIGIKNVCAAKCTFSLKSKSTHPAANLTVGLIKYVMIYFIMDY